MSQESCVTFYLRFYQWIVCPEKEDENHGPTHQCTSHELITWHVRTIIVFLTNCQICMLCHILKERVESIWCQCKELRFRGGCSLDPSVLQPDGRELNTSNMLFTNIHMMPGAYSIQNSIIQKINGHKASANICISNTPTFYALRMNFCGRIFFWSLSPPRCPRWKS